MRFRCLVLTVVLLAAACAGPSTSSDAQASGIRGQGMTGTFHGDRALEGGCSWLETNGTRYQLTLPHGYRVDYERLTIVGPDGKPVAKAGDTITVTGHEASGQLSFCQIGPIFKVETISSGS